MTSRNLRASITIDLLGNIANRSRQFSGSISRMARSSQAALRGLRAGVVSTSTAIDNLGNHVRGTFGALTTGALAITGSGYAFNRLFIAVASQRENQRIALNSMYKGDKAHAQAMMQWAIQNAKDSTWGLSGVMQELVSSKSFGMKDDEAKNFITMLQDQGAMHGWDLNAAQGASMQLKQMFSRQQITAADANLLTGYGINVYQVLADRLGKSMREIRDQGEKGKLGIKSIREVFRALSEESKGAQASAMNSWTGLTAQLGDVWEGFADKLMNKGPFERLKGQVRGVLTWYDRISKPGANGASELDTLTDNLATNFNTAFDAIKSGANSAWAVLKRIASVMRWINDNVVSLKTAAKAIAGVWAANKVLRIGAAMARPVVRAGTAPFRAAKWWKNRNNPAAKLAGLGVQQVFVTNWPGGGVGFDGSDVAGEGKGKGKRKRGPGKGRTTTPRVKPSGPAAKVGMFARLWNGTKGLFASGSKLGKLAKVGGRVASIGGKVAARAAGPLLAAATTLPVLLDDQASTHDKGSAIGSTAGAWVGGAIGSIAGPIGTVAGATLGNFLGDYLGGFAADMYTKFTSDSKPAEPPPEQKVSANAALKVELADGLKITSTSVQENGMGLNVYTGSNFYPY